MHRLRFVPTSIHAAADYIVGAALIVLPFALGLQGSARWTLIGAGFVVFAYSLCTDYELGALRLIGMPAHLALDAGFALAMFILPWITDVPKATMIFRAAAIALICTTRLRRTND